MHKTKIIAEIANAHQGDVNTLKQLVCEAAETGADAVKFQWFKYDSLATPDYEWYEAYVKLFIDESDWQDVIVLSLQLNLEVWIDIFDNWGLEMARKHRESITGFKIPPTIIQSKRLMRDIISLNKPILLGVGGWYDHEIEKALQYVDSLASSSITLMYGFQGYPTKEEDVNLARLQYIKEKYRCEVGFADHEDADNLLAIDLPVHAYFAGATVIEKHLTLNRASMGYDYYSSLHPAEFRQMVLKLRQAEIVMGEHNVNEAQRNYLKDALMVVANQDIREGEVINFEKVMYKRASDSDGFMPIAFEKALPMIANKTIKLNQSIKPQEVVKPVVTIVVVARLKSTRLKQKALLPINGVESVKRCLLNCLAATKVDHVVLATSYLQEDAPLAQLTVDSRVKIIKGDPDNVAKRMLEAIEGTDTNIILRITGDCPVVSPEIIDYLIEQHFQSGADCTLPDNNHAVGTAADVYTVESLIRLLSSNDSLDYTEYLSFYFMNNSHLFNVKRVELPKEYQYPEWRLTLDEQKDYQMFNELYKQLNVGEEALYFARIREYLLANPEIANMNAEVALKWRDQLDLLEKINMATTFKK